MEKLLIPKLQPNFPHEDVDPVNAALFSQLLFEASFVEAAHDLAEQHVVAFRVGHQTLKSLSQLLYMDYVQQHAFSYGATIYEALAVVVRPTAPHSENPLLIKVKADEVLTLATDAFNAGISLRDQEEQMRDVAPITADLIGTAAQLTPQFDRRFVMMGAAAERSIDRDTMELAA